MIKTKKKQHEYRELDEIYKLCFPNKDFDKQIQIFEKIGANLEVLQQKNTVSSFVIWHKISDQEFEILDLGTHPKHQNQGFASKILSNLSINLESGDKLMLEVAANNKAAINLYLKNGFHKSGVRKNYYLSKTEKVDAILMQKII